MKCVIDELDDRLTHRPFEEPWGEDIHQRFEKKREEEKRKRKRKREEETQEREEREEEKEEVTYRKNALIRGRTDGD